MGAGTAIPDPFFLLRSGAGPGPVLAQALLEGVQVRPDAGAGGRGRDGRRVPHLQIAGRPRPRQQQPPRQHLRGGRPAFQQVTGWEWRWERDEGGGNAGGMKKWVWGGGGGDEGDGNGNEDDGDGKGVGMRKVGREWE